MADDLDLATRSVFAHFLSIQNRSRKASLTYEEVRESLAKQGEPAVLFAYSLVTAYLADGFAKSIEQEYLLRLCILNLKQYIEKYGEQPVQPELN